MTTPITGPSGNVADIIAPPASAATAKPDAMGKDTFLKLLVAQLKYQNPLSPTDGTEFMAQTAQFSVVEKLEELTKQNTQVLASNQSLMANALIGKQVVSGGLDGTDVVSTVTGVRLGPGGPVLLTGSTEVMLGAVKEVRPALPAADPVTAPSPAAAPAPAATAPGTTTTEATAPETATPEPTATETAA